MVEVVKEDGKKNWGSWNKIKSKHVDYLVWDLVESRVVMAIELDGGSHNGSSAEKNDEFKNSLFEVVGLNLVRVKVGDSFEDEVKKISEQLGH